MCSVCWSSRVVRGAGCVDGHASSCRASRPYVLQSRPRKQAAEACDRLGAAGAGGGERRHLLREVERPDAQHAGAEHRRVGRVEEARGRDIRAGWDVPVEHLHEEGGGVVPEVEPWVVAHVLEADERHGRAALGREPQAVLHDPFVEVARLHEEVEPAALDREPAAEGIGVQVAARGALVLVARHELVDVGCGDRELEHHALVPHAGILVRGSRVAGAEDEEARHLLGERDRGRRRVPGLARGRGRGRLVGVRVHAGLLRRGTRGVAGSACASAATRRARGRQRGRRTRRS